MGSGLDDFFDCDSLVPRESLRNCHHSNSVPISVLMTHQEVAEGIAQRLGADESAQ